MDFDDLGTPYDPHRYFLAHCNNSIDEAEFKINKFTWLKLLDLACSYGWEPEGTELDFDYSPGGAPLPREGYKDLAGYFEHAGQRVSLKDAAIFADSLEAALDDIPDFNCIVWPPNNWEPDLDDIYAASEEFERKGSKLDIPLFELFSGERKQLVIDFIDFCRKGTFAIR